jgi:uncharacterized membrane protein
MTTITVQVTVPAFDGQTMSDSDNFTLTVQSVEDAGLTLTAVGQTSYLMTAGAISSPDAAQTGAFGQTLTYTVAVTNTGDYADSFAVEIHGATWQTLSDVDEVGPLAPGESAEVIVTVTVGQGASDSAAVRFISALDNDVWTETMLYSDTRLLFLPVIVN